MKCNMSVTIQDIPKQDGGILKLYTIGFTCKSNARMAAKKKAAFDALVKAGAPIETLSITPQGGNEYVAQGYK